MAWNLYAWSILTRKQFTILKNVVFGLKIQEKMAAYTAMLGKWHVAVDAGYGRDWDYQKVWNRAKYPDNAPNYYDNQLIETNGGKAVITKGYTTDNYTDWAVDYINGKIAMKASHGSFGSVMAQFMAPFTPAERHLNDYPNASVPKKSGISTKVHVLTSHSM